MSTVCQMSFLKSDQTFTYISVRPLNFVETFLAEEEAKPDEPAKSEEPEKSEVKVPDVDKAVLRQDGRREDDQVVAVGQVVQAGHRHRREVHHDDGHRNCLQKDLKVSYCKT